MKMTVYDTLRFATIAHKGQYRKYTGEEYITHPIAVADLVEEYMDSKGTFSEEEIQTAIQIALLHDTVEDTETTIETIQELFGFKVAQGVWFLTKTPAFVGNRAERKHLCETRLAQAPDIIKIIKTCDMFHNSLSIEEHDPNFWTVFKAETASLMVAMGTVETMDLWENMEKNQINP
jgi:(p)ppGpp synthase/HD superfamily hydrolase